MNDEERYIVQGRARDAAKKLHAEVATLDMFFREYDELLQRTRVNLAVFLRDPVTGAPDGGSMVDVVNRLQRELCRSGFCEASTEFVEKTRKLYELEKQVKNF